MESDLGEDPKRPGSVSSDGQHRQVAGHGGPGEEWMMKNPGGANGPGSYATHAWRDVGGNPTSKQQQQGSRQQAEEEHAMAVRLGYPDFHGSGVLPHVTDYHSHAYVMHPGYASQHQGLRHPMPEHPAGYRRGTSQMGGGRHQHLGVDGGYPLPYGVAHPMPGGQNFYLVGTSPRDSQAERAPGPNGHGRNHSQKATPLAEPSHQQGRMSMESLASALPSASNGDKPPGGRHYHGQHHGGHHQGRDGGGNGGGGGHHKHHRGHRGHRRHGGKNDRSYNRTRNYGGYGNGNNYNGDGGGRDRGGKSMVAIDSRYTDISQCKGHVYSMCKDQYDCRFLQRQLDDQTNGEVTALVLEETKEHFVDLMTDPFGNYLCQKLLEHCNDAQRLVLIEVIARDLVCISKNMHGTRAVQTMIEFLKSSSHIQIVVKALQSSVVQLIQDLNGNHVIQRCLNCLSSANNQFIYNAVARNCVDVATHRHGCCVFQRCIDHGSRPQKLQLVSEIIKHAPKLVRDPYGNYVVQYILDLSFKEVHIELPRKFKGSVADLASQKFSSPVIEKCLTVSPPETIQWIVQELIESEKLTNVLQDPFGNYVIQTALDVSDPETRRSLIQHIRPHLPMLRGTPYSKRIQSKLEKEELAGP